MSFRNLEELLKAVGNPVTMLRNSQIGAYVYPVVPSRILELARRTARLARKRRTVRPVAPHGRAYVKGPDALKLLSHLGTNSFANFPVNRAKQFAPCSYGGHVIGDGILFHLEENKLVFVGRAPAANWIQFHAETGGYKVETEKDDRSPSQSAGQGRHPQALSFPDSGTQGQADPRQAQWRADAGNQVLPHGLSSTSRGASVRALRHGMAGAPGLEIWGPYAEGEEIRDCDRRSRQGFRTSCKWARAPTRPTRSSRAGSRPRCRRYIPARK